MWVPNHLLSRRALATRPRPGRHGLFVSVMIALSPPVPASWPGLPLVLLPFLIRLRGPGDDKCWHTVIWQYRVLEQALDRLVRSWKL